MARHEAVFIEAECIEYNQKFYLRFDYAADDMWVQTYGVKEKERSARTSGGSRSIDMSQTRIGPQYKCPYCGNPDTKVIDSRPAEDGSSIRRRRACDICGKRFTTYEKIETIPLIIIKKDNNREQYSRQKIENGIIRACYKRPVPTEKIQQAVNNIETKVFSLEEKEIPSSVVGELVMDELKDLDEVAYVRFASVYREFKDVNTFMDELKKILDKEEK